MKYYSIAEIDVTDQRWVASYVQNVTPMVERAGGRYLARTAQLEKIEGDRPRPQIALIIEWPSREAATTFYESAEYRPYRESRLAGAVNRFLLVAGEDMTGTATA
jgi:uncharacterized protein (DUF1330 family)